MSRFEVISETEAVERYEDVLDCDGPVYIGSLSYAASHVLRRVDPTAYECGFLDFVDSLTYDDIYVEGHTDTEMDSEEDGQPDEAQEWESFDPEC
jgi:hypothetical protein